MPDIFFGGMGIVLQTLLTKWLNQVVKKEKDFTTEQKILDAAKRVFFQKGMAGARMQDIANEAGINKALLHYYFRSKENLHEVIFQQAFGTMMPKVAEIFGREGAFEEKLRAFVDVYISMALSNPFLPMFVLGEMHSGADSIVKKHFLANMQQLPFQKIRQDIQDAAKRGEIMPIEPVQLMLNVMALCLFPFIARPLFQTINQLSDAQYEKLLKARKKEVADFILRSIRP